MKRHFILLFFLPLFIQCNKKEEKPVKTEKAACSYEKTNSQDKKFKMYKMSEMAALMEQMYVDNQRLKERIKKGDTIGKFPNHFLQIHKAVMTDETENDAFFKKQANAFIRAQELIYKDPIAAKQHFNDGVNACIECHQVKCSGPIPRIKKLYIE
jgi:hypothetical protein